MTESREFTREAGAELCGKRTEDRSRRHQRGGGPPAAYTRKFSTDHAGAFSADPVCVTLTNFACTGRNVAMMVAGEPVPCATGAPQVFPSIDSCTL